MERTPCRHIEATSQDIIKKFNVSSQMGLPNDNDPTDAEVN